MARPSGPPAAKRFADSLAFLLGFSILFVPSARAAWDAAGETVPRLGCSPAVSGCSDGAGGLLTFWTDFEDGQRLFVHRRLADGSTAPGWPENGVRVAPAPNLVPSIVAIPDGEGGAYVLTCATFLSVPDKRLRLWRVRADGASQPGWPDSGVAIPGGGRGKSGTLIGDGLGGAFVGWIEFIDPQVMSGRVRATHELRVTRVDRTGVLARNWPRGGKVLFTAATGSLPSEPTAMPVLEADGAGGVYVAYADSSDGTQESRVHHLNGRGVIVAGWPPSGVALGSPERAIQIADLALDAEGGVFALAREGSAFAAVSRLARLAANGSPAPGWPADGHLLFPGTADTRLPVGVVGDGTGGAMLATLELAGTQLGFRFLRVSADGATESGWTADGLAVADDLALAESRAFPDGAGGLTLVSTRFRQPIENQVVVRRVTPEATFLPDWPAEGQVLVDWGPDGRLDAVAVDGTRAVYAVHTTNSCQTLAFRTGEAPAPRPAPRVLAADAPKLRVSPNPARSDVRFSLTLKRSGPVTLEVVDLNGRVLRSLRDDLPIGEHVLIWDGNAEDGRPAPPGLYFVRARGGAGLTTARLVRLR